MICAARPALYPRLELFGFTSAFAEECTSLRQSVVAGGAPGRRLIEVSLHLINRFICINVRLVYNLYSCSMIVA